MIFSQAAISVKIGFGLSCPILEKDNFIDIFYIVMSY